MGDNSLVITGKLELNAVNPPYFSSIWWKDICRGVGQDTGVDWFLDGVVRQVGNEELVRIWHNVWVGEEPLKVVFQGCLSSLTLRIVVSRRPGVWGATVGTRGCLGGYIFLFGKKDS